MGTAWRVRGFCFGGCMGTVWRVHGFCFGGCMGFALVGALVLLWWVHGFCFFFVVLAISVLMENPAIGFDNAGLIRALAWLVAIECFAYCWWSHELMGLVTWFCSRPRLMRASGFCVGCDR